MKVSESGKYPEYYIHVANGKGGKIHRVQAPASGGRLFMDYRDKHKHKERLGMMYKHGSSCKVVY